MNTKRSRARGVPARRRWHRVFGLVAIPLVVAGLLWTTQAAPATEVVGAFKLRRPTVLQTTPPDPVRFLSELELVMPKPAVALTVGDAVAQELMRQSHTLSEQDALRTAQALVEEARSLLKTALGRSPPLSREFAPLKQTLGRP